MSYPHYTGEDEDWGSLGGRRCARYTAGPTPRIVCLCGSTRFREAFMSAQADFTMRSYIVLSVGLFGKQVSDVGKPDENLVVTDEQKVMLDELHKRKIDLAHEVFVLNVGGYIGESTRSEIEYAEKHHVPVTYLEPT